MVIAAQHHLRARAVRHLCKSEQQHVVTLVRNEEGLPRLGGCNTWQSSYEIRGALDSLLKRSRVGEIPVRNEGPARHLLRDVGPHVHAIDGRHAGVVVRGVRAGQRQECGVPATRKQGIGFLI